MSDHAKVVCYCHVVDRAPNVPAPLPAPQPPPAPMTFGQVLFGLGVLLVAGVVVAALTDD